jgi:hypothetical protein
MKFIKKSLVFLILSTNLFAADPYNREFQIGYLMGTEEGYQLSDALALPDSHFVVSWVAVDDWARRNGNMQLLLQDGKAAAPPIRIFHSGEHCHGRIHFLLAENKYLMCHDVSASESGSACQNSYSISCQYYSFENEPIGSSFSVHPLNMKDYLSYNIILLSNGNIVIAWNHRAEASFYDQSFFQIFSPTGDSVMDTRVISENNSDMSVDVCIQPLKSGNFIMLWHEGGVFNRKCHVQFINSTGSVYNEHLYDDTQLWHLRTLKNGSSLIFYTISYRSGIFMQLFDGNGDKKGEALNLSISSDYVAGSPCSAELTNGRVVFCWSNYDHTLGQNYNIYFQIISSDGQLLGSPFHALNEPLKYLDFIAFHALSDDRFIILWNSGARIFTGNGTPEYSEFRVRDTRNGLLAGPQIDTGFGKILVSWNSEHSVYGKIYPEKPQIHELRPFVVLSPYQDNTLNENKTEFYWRRASGEQISFPFEVTYLVYLSKKIDFSQPRVVTVQADTMVEIQNLDWGESYYWKVCAKNIAGDSLWSGNTILFHVPKKTGIESIDKKLPDQYALHQNYPNPFNPETSIRFDLPQAGFVLISVYDISGRLVRMLVSESRTTGSYSVKWDGRDSAGNAVPSGIYVCRMEARSADGRESVLNKKMSLIK